MDQSQPEALYYRGLCLYYSGNHPQAIAHAQSALRNDPDYVPARYVALLFFRAEQLADRRSALQYAPAEGQAARCAQG